MLFKKKNTQKTTTNYSTNITIFQFCELLGSDFTPFAKVGISPNAIVNIDDYVKENAPYHNDTTVYRIAGSPHGARVNSYWPSAADPYDPTGADVIFAENYFKNWSNKNILSNLVSYFDLPEEIIIILDKKPEHCISFKKACENFCEQNRRDGKTTLANYRLATGSSWGISFFVSKYPNNFSDFGNFLQNLTITQRCKLCEYMLMLIQKQTETC